MDQQFVASFEQTLVQATQGETVKAATAKLSNEFYKNPSSLPVSITICQTNSNDQIRLLAAVEARKLVNKFWDTTDDATKSQIRESLLSSAFTDSSKNVRHQLARVISAVTLYDLAQWSNLLPLLSAAVTDDSNVQGKETAAYILLSIVETQNEEFGAHIESFFSLFQKTILDQSSLPVRIYSVQALGNIASVAEEIVDENPQLANAFKSSVPAMVQVLKEVIAAGDEVNAKLVFNTFNDLLLLNAKLIGDNLIHLVQLMIEISVDTQVDEDIRNFSITFLSSAIMYRKNKISSKKLGRDITLACLKIAAEEIDVEAELDNEDDDDNENEESDPSSLALRLIAIASAELPASQVVATIFEQLPALLTSANQFERRGGLAAIGIAVRGAPDYFTSYLPKIVQAISAGLKDSELIVRVAALKSLAQLIQELQDLLSEHYEELLPSIISIIDSATKYTVYKYACISLDALIEFMSMDAVTKYLEPLMNKLFQMLGNTENSKLRAIIISAIGSTAFAAGSSFVPYFAKSIELLEPFIQNTGHIEGMSEDDIELRALTFENISTMARAVRSESFSKVAQPLIEASYVAITSENGRLREAGYAFIYNMAKVYGKDFAPFLDKIIPEIFKTLAQEEFNLNFGEDEDAEDFADMNEEELNEKLQFHTGITIEKESAAITLSELAVGTKELFVPYLEQSVQVLSEQARESYDMRESALAALWKIVESFIAMQVEKTQYPKGIPTASYVDETVLKLIKHTRELSLESLPTEVEISMVTAVLDSFTDLIKKYGAIIITDSGNTDDLQTLCVELMKLLNSEHPAQNFDDEDLPEDEEVDASETDSMLYDSALEVLVSLSFALGGDFNNIFASFKDTIVAGVKSQAKNKKSSSIGALADISAGIKEANPYSQEFLQLLIERLQHDKSLEVKSNAAYGVGIVIFYSVENFTAIYSDIFNALSKLLSKVQKQEATVDQDDEDARDVINRSYANACGCVARLTLKSPESTPLNVVMPILLDHLPLEIGFEENAPIFELIAKLYQTSIDQVAPFTGRIVEVFAHVFVKEQERERLERDSTLGREENIDRLKQFETPELKQKVVELLKFIESQHAGSVSSNELLAKVIA
ncbi:hypothetical protein WICPIJ_006654 [Wickerhamomyces pijperi]|uniref:Importin N-terminal domain-containing protein n=1 Tax=Wickerhamomyces pijperi TaxID=599730 RepID=A0A9P8Q3L2_WICPI|nr:hypothetical protein WICPIJ_006654 [Wickerhamomyces pijperi]